MKKIYLNGHNLELSSLVLFANGPKSHQLSIDPSARDKLEKSHQFVMEIVNSGIPVYGINTGFGALSNKFINKNQLGELQLNLIRSHCTGIGHFFSPEMTRIIMVLRANCLLSGNSGIHPDIVQLIFDFINHDIIPLIPQKGSVGASGDLAPLAQMALCLIGEGNVLYAGEKICANEVLKRLGLLPAKLGPKDGLALINGTAIMTAQLSWAVIKAQELVKIADVAAAITVDATRGTRQAFRAEISSLKPHPGQVLCASNLYRLIENSEIAESHKNCHKVQDAYSLRCIPQVHGAIRQTLTHAQNVVEIELNSVTDNPLVFSDSKEVISGGNFHGEALALAMDYLSMGLAELANICERRIEKMMNPTFSDLPAFLASNSGLHSGLMIAHVTVAALVSENKILAHPASVDSIPTSTDKEDHVSMGVTAGHKLHQILENVKYCLAIELLCNTQALEFLKPLKTSPSLHKIYSVIREHVPPIDFDRVLNDDINKIVELIDSGTLVQIIDSFATTIGEIK